MTAPLARPRFKMPVESAPSLAEQLTREEQQALAVRLHDVLLAGFGELTIVIKAGKIRFLKVQYSHAPNLTGAKKTDSLPDDSAQ